MIITGGAWGVEGVWCWTVMLVIKLSELTFENSRDITKVKFLVFHHCLVVINSECLSITQIWYDK